MKQLSFLIGALLLAGCTPESASLPYPLTIRSDGVGPFHPGDPFDPKLLAAKAVGFEFEKVSQISPSDPKTILLLKRGNNAVLYLSSDKSGERIGSITVLSPLIADLHGHKIGDPIPTDPTLHCEGDECRYELHPSIVYRMDQTRTIREITLQRL